MQLARDLDIAGTRVITTTAVVIEIARVEVLGVGSDIDAEGYEMVGSHTDKPWTLVDCISFVTMRERGITDALTADRRLQQAGFRALLLEDG